MVDYERIIAGIVALTCGIGFIFSRKSIANSQSNMTFWKKVGLAKSAPDKETVIKISERFSIILGSLLFLAGIFLILQSL